MMAGEGHAVWGIEELFCDILLRVPAMEIGGLRRVSKLWKSYIDGQLFAQGVKAQYSRNPTSLICCSGHFPPEHLFGPEAQLDPDRGPEQLLHIPPTIRIYLSYHAHGHTKLLDIPPILRREDQHLQSVEGIVCFDNGPVTCLWNPIARLLKKLPTTHPDFPPHFGRIYHGWFRTHSALGYDPNTQGHVILKTWVHFSPEDRDYREWDDDGIEELTGHKILRNNTDRWRTLEFKGPIERTRRCICIDGRIYFLTVDRMRRRAIVAFILASEEFLTIPLPQNAMEEPHDLETELIELGGHLTLSELRAAENGIGVAISLYIRQPGGNWTVRQIQVTDDRYRRGLVGSVTGRKLVIVPRIQKDELRELLYDVEEEISREVIVGVLHRPSTLSVCLAPIHYLPTTFRI